MMSARTIKFLGALGVVGAYLQDRHGFSWASVLTLGLGIWLVRTMINRAYMAGYFDATTDVSVHLAEAVQRQEFEAAHLEEMARRARDN